MEIEDAIRLITPALPEKVHDSQWADLGCGSGTFTVALSHLLGAESRIYAIDKQSQVIHFKTDVKIEFIQADFSKDKLSISNMNGILMANSLHYIHDKPGVVQRVKKYLRREGQLIVVEYDTERKNQWIPYPLSFEQLKNLFSAEGFTSVRKIGEYDSMYSSDKMYACVINR